VGGKGSVSEARGPADTLLTYALIRHLCLDRNFALDDFID
jgi:hypothetical protein